MEGVEGDATCCGWRGDGVVGELDGGAGVREVRVVDCPGWSSFY